MKFAPQIAELQLEGHCGPCSLSTCLYILGIEAKQRDLAKAAGAPVSVYKHGIDEKRIRRAAAAYGAKAQFLLVVQKHKGESFKNRLLRHLEKGLPAILCVWDFSHWIAVIGYLREKDKFIIVDPRDDKSIFSRYSKNYLMQIAWNENKDENIGEPSQYFAILLSRKDGNPPRWRVTESWLRLCERGSEDTAVNMANDLIEIARRAAPNWRNGGSGYYMTQVLDQYEDLVIDTVNHWVGNEKVSKQDVRTFYEDYKVIAASTAIRLPRNTDHMALVAQISTLLSIYACKGTL